MTHNENLETVIRRYLPLGKMSSKGYEVVKCQICHDYQERGGFKFDGGDVYYNCFNCGTKGQYIAEKNRHSIPRKLRDILIAFGVNEAEFTRAISLNFFKEKVDPVKKELPAALGFPSTEVMLPAGSVLVSACTSEWCEVAKFYIRLRGLSVTDHAWYVTDQRAHEGRLLIPYFFKGKIIYWQGRSMDPTVVPRYKNPMVEKNNIFFNMDELYRYTTEPLFVTEGPFDAISIGRNAVALAGSTLTDFKVAELKKVGQRRKVIFVIDKNQNGFKLGSEILKVEESIDWNIVTLPDNLEDSNDVIQKLGRLWLITYLTTSAVRGFKGRLTIELNCTKE